MSKRPRPQPLGPERDHNAPDLDAIEALGRAAFATIPKRLRRLLSDVAIRVEDFPDESVMEAMALSSPFDILGLYSGVTLGQKAAVSLPGEVDMIFLYRRPIIDYWVATGEDLADVIRHVLIHEIGHHFGLSDEDMERIEAAG